MPQKVAEAISLVTCIPPHSTPPTFINDVLCTPPVTSDPTTTKVPEGHEVRLFGRTIAPFIGPMLTILLAMSCGTPASPGPATSPPPSVTRSTPEQPASATADAGLGAPSANLPTIEQCEQVLSRMADLAIAHEPPEAADIVAIKKKFVVAKSRKEGLVNLCMQGTRAMADCLIQASDAESQKRCALLP